MPHRHAEHHRGQTADERYKRMGDIALRLLPVLTEIAGIKAAHHRRYMPDDNEDSADLSRLVAIGVVGTILNELTTNNIQFLTEKLGIERAARMWAQLIDLAGISANDLEEFRNFISK